MNKLNLDALAKFKEHPMNKTIQFDLSLTAKEKIKQNVKRANVNMSTYMRGVALSEDIIYVIDEKGCVAQAIIEANDILNYSLNNGIISEFVCNKLIHKLCYVLNKLESIYDEISKISESENPIPEMTNNNYSPGCKKSHIQFMVSKELKEYIANKADSLNMSISQFLRVSALTERKVIVLGKGNYVSRYLIELQNKLNVVLKEEKINLNRRNSIESTFKDIFKKFIDISLMLTNITALEGSKDEEEDE